MTYTCGGWREEGKFKPCQAIKRKEKPSVAAEKSLIDEMSDAGYLTPIEVAHAKRILKSGSMEERMRKARK